MAVFLVFLEHYSDRALILGRFEGVGHVVMSALYGYGNFGVELFFVLSGYLIYGTLVRRSPSFMAFIRRRSVRIYPAFLVAFGIYFLLNLAMPVEGKVPSDLGAAVVWTLANLALLPGLFPIRPLVAVNWSLSYEMFFYAATAVTVRLLAFPQRSADSRVAILGAMLGCFTVACLFIPAMPVRMMPFFVGMLLAEGIGVTAVMVPRLVGLLAPVAAFFICRMVDLSVVASEVLHCLAFFALCSVCLSVKGRDRLLEWTPLRLLGNMSYSYYLLHGLTLTTVSIVVARVFGNDLPTWLLWLAMPAIFAMSLGPAFILFVLVERPISLTKPRRRDPAQVSQPA